MTEAEILATGGCQHELRELLPGNGDQRGMATISGFGFSKEVDSDGRSEGNGDGNAGGR